MLSRTLLTVSVNDRVKIQLSYKTTQSCVVLTQNGGMSSYLLSNNP